MLNFSIRFNRPIHIFRNLNAKLHHILPVKKRYFYFSIQLPVSFYIYCQINFIRLTYQSS